VTVLGSSFDFVFSNLDIQDLNVWKIQQLLDLNLHCDALNNTCWFMTTISWDISRQLPKSQKFDRRGVFFITAMIFPVTISLPKGGGALRGLGEKFAPDLQTGTGNFSVPIAFPSGRHGFQPGLSLVYSSGNGNSVFGLGWS